MSYKNKTYQGWKNYFTWNVALCIDNEANLYFSARDFMKNYSGRTPYISFIEFCGFTKYHCTIDGVRFFDKRISRREMNNYMKELID